MPSADRLIEIYNEASVRTPGAERDAFLAQSCGNDISLREKIVALLHSFDQAGNFLQEPMFGPTGGRTEKPGDTIGRYKLLEKIGEGGCGVVYVAEQIDPVRRRVALKVIKLGMDTKQVIARFEAERQALAMMDHPNIARVFDAGSTETGRPYFVMELVLGLRITEFCDKNQLSTRERLDLFIKVCQAVQHAHQKGVIHRDIKPSNILVTLHDGTPMPKVIDFGIAKATEGRLSEGTVYTQFLQFVGTPAYMSPEQAGMSGLDVDTRADIYSLGVLLYELLTGQPPFDGQKLIASGLDAMRKTIRETEPDRPSTKLRQTLAVNNARSLPSPSSIRTPHSAIDDDLDWIVMKCLEKDRSRRYETANGLAADLTRHLSNEPVMARPPSAVDKLRKALRRNRLAFAAASAVTIALLAGSSISIWQALEASRARNDALRESIKARMAQAEAQKAQKAEKEEKVLAQRDSYIANMNLAGQAWEQNNYLMVQKLLEDTRAFSHRGFEWYYWQRQTHLNLTAFHGHFATVRSIAFFPDDQQVITGSDDHSARVWDTATGEERFALLGHKAAVNAVAVSSDGRLLATASTDEKVKIWESRSGRTLQTLTGYLAGVTALAFSPRGDKILTGTSDGTLRIQELTTQRLMIKVVQAHASQITSVAFAPDGETVMTGSWDRTAKVWRSTDGSEVFSLRRHLKPVLGVAFSPNGRNILTAGEDSVVKFWDAETGSELSLRLATNEPMAALAFSRDGRRIVTGSWSSNARVWNATNAEAELLIRGHVRGLQTVAISADGNRVVTAGGDHIVKVWDTEERPVRLRVKGNATNSVLAVAISPNGERIAIGSGTLGNDGTVTGSGEEALQVWDSSTKKRLLTISGHAAGVSSLTFSPDGGRIVSGSGDRTAKIWDAASGALLATLKGHASAVTSVAFFAHGERVVTGSHDQSARVWNSRAGQPLFILPGHTGPISSVAASPNGHWIATGSFDDTTRLWDASSGRLVRTLETPASRIYSVAFSPDSDRLAIAGWGLPTVWELTNTNRKPVTLYGHSVPIASITFSPDGQRILTGSMDNTAKLWEAATGRELLTLLGHTEWVYSVSISSDGQRIATGSKDQTVRIWDAATQNQVAAWEDQDRAGLKTQSASRREVAAFEEKYKKTE